MSKTKFAFGAVLGAAISYWATKEYNLHKDELISFITDKMDRVPKVDKQQLKKVFDKDTKKLQQALETGNSAEVQTNFDDIKLDAEQIKLDK
ncbi:hypothetical protein [Bombilactobacillus bombi]|uniref:hypothetical protein n=1 Tax=Bombilactobacillus bombi TaxID=1303590 RepID=UPI0015E5BEBF|nr:hypothetical protein [Bombilactobacillus bombi]MBA1435242.1 hypothetical protein [Bombilactobacillus bombi]